MRQTEAHITSANINPSARTGNIRAKSRRDPWCPAASSNSPLTISFTAQPACRHLPLLPMKGVQPASLLRLLYLLYNMNCRGLNPATRRHLSYKTVRGRNGEEVVVIDDLFEARIQDLSDLTSSFLTFFTHFLKWAPAASGRPLSGARARYRRSTPLPSSPLPPPRTARAQQPLRAAQRLPKRPYGPPEEGLVAPLGTRHS